MTDQPVCEICGGYYQYLYSTPTGHVHTECLDKKNEETIVL
jgi:hypothetical protein